MRRKSASPASSAIAPSWLIVIACVGLFGLSALMVTYRTREIGIRKVLGASVPGIVRSLNTEYVVVVVVVLANLIAWPLAYLGVEQLLQFHAYRIDISWPIFLLAGSLSLAIAVLTVSYQSIRAALVDPAQTLRYESFFCCNNRTRTPLYISIPFSAGLPMNWHNR